MTALARALALPTAPGWRLALAVAVVLGGCATRPPAIAESPWITGRLSLRVDALGDSPARSLGAGFELQGNSDRGELRLSSPLGTLLAAARWSPGEAVLRTPDREQRFADLDALSREALGEAMPLQALPDWLGGRPWPGAPNRPEGPGFEQLGWRIDLARFGDGWVEAVREQLPRVTVKLRLEPAP